MYLAGFLVLNVFPVYIFRDKFAFSATNHKIYLMNFSLHKSEISLLATLTEHMDEVTQVLIIHVE